MTDKSNFDQQGQTVHGSQINVAGDIHGDVIQTKEQLPVPRQIPPPPQDFTGRDEELDDILNGFEQGVTIAGLRGLGGIGKTALAFVLAQKLRDRYPDGRLMVDLKGTSTFPLPPAEAMAQVIRSYHPTANLPDDETGLRGLYLSVLNGKRALLLLDNAAADRQARSLLPPATCGVLVTSRRKFTLPGLAAKDLGTLKPEKAVELLIKVWNSASPSYASGVADDALREIARLCGHLPLALRAAGSFLANTPDLNPSDYAERLRDERTRLERLGSEGVDLDVEASFNLSYARLSAETARAFRMMTAFPADFDALAEEAVCVDEDHRHLSELVRWSLVEYQASGQDGVGRYRLHDLSRLFASARLEEERGDTGRAAARQRHSEHYMKMLSYADELYLKGREGILDGLRLFDLEWANIQAGQAWAEERMTSEDDSVSDGTLKSALRLSSSYPDAGSYVLDLRLHPNEKIRWLKIAIVAAQQLKDRNMEGAHLGSLGLAYADLGETRRAIEFYEQRIAIAREIVDRRGEGAALGNLGIAYKNLGETRRAIEFYEQRIAIAREIGDRRGEGNALGNLGNAYADLGETRRAIEFYEKHLAIAREIGDRRGEGNDLGNLGNAYADLGETRRAIEFYEKRIAIAREIGDRRGEGNALFNMSLSLDKLDKRAQAIECASTALKIYEEIESPHAETVRRKLAEWQDQS